MKVILSTTLILILLSQAALAQNSSMEFEDVEEVRNITSTFNGSHIVNTQSTNVMEGGRLNFLIGHRFGAINEGAFNLFGMDFSSIRLGFEYGITDRLTAGLGRSSLGKNYDGSLKYRILTQTKGAKNMPVSLVGFVSSSFSAVDVRSDKNVSDNHQFSNHMVHTFQLLASHEFSHLVSVQISPTLIHRNQVDSKVQDNDIISTGIGARVKLSKKMHLNADYHYVFNKDSDRTLHDPIALGLDIVTGGHVFKIHLSNSVGMIEKEYITNTTDDFFDGDIRIGFTVLRSFVIKPKVAGGSIL